MRNTNHEQFDEQPFFRADEQTASGIPVRNARQTWSPGRQRR